MPHLFDPITFRGVTLPNRIGVSPMCQYSSENGRANDWHVVHLGARAQGGAGLVITEATAVEARGRISPQDAGLWDDAQIESWARVARFIESQMKVPGMQIAHAGRKASTARPWEGGGGIPPEKGGWTVIAPSTIPFSDGYPMPVQMTRDTMDEVRNAFAATARRALVAGFRWIELHAAHGYLLNEFLSPLSNHRTDEYGGSFENRVRFPIEVTRAVRDAMPDDVPLAVRLSCTDWVEGGWTIEDSIELSRRMRDAGVDLIDCSSGGNVPKAKIEIAPGYQVPFAEAIRHYAKMPTAAVGLITEAHQADAIVREGKADVVLIARELLRDPYWPIRAAKELGHSELCPPPVQYGRAFH
jgi:2,4-dienoyl-CoA reductase-like NADH-dependent reductase (Old Yellow Enzyme family)